MRGRQGRHLLPVRRARRGVPQLSGVPAEGPVTVRYGRTFVATLTGQAEDGKILAAHHQRQVVDVTAAEELFVHRADGLFGRLVVAGGGEIAGGDDLRWLRAPRCCALSLDEFAYSARSAAEHTEASRRLRTSFLYLPLSPAIDQLILDIRAALWNAGTGRAAGVIDVALAATAVDSAATVLHYDSDFDHITAAYPPLRASWVVPRGSID